nr:MAG TPA: hypothetical protein [Caudoviricetes sp.]
MHITVSNLIGTTLRPEVSSNILYTLGFPIFKYGSRLYHTCLVTSLSSARIIVVERPSLSGINPYEYFYSQKFRCDDYPISKSFYHT